MPSKTPGRDSMPSNSNSASWPMAAFREQAQALFSQKLWPQQTRPLSPEAIRSLAAAGEVQRSPFQDELGNADEHHARRVAYFLRNFDPAPLRVEIEKDRPVITDGKHRLAAAWLSGATEILCYSEDPRATPAMLSPTPSSETEAPREPSAPRPRP